MSLESQAAGIGALADDTRRALYEYVVAQAEPVGRERAAKALGIAQHNVNFHLDRLVDEGLLVVEFKRLSGRTGPGAGRPSKLYRRSDREFSVTLPPRRYDLVGDILAAAVTRATAGEPLDDVLGDVARTEGLALGEAGRSLGDPNTPEGLARVLGTQGYEPQVRDGVVELDNCPFDSLARKHTGLVCTLNKSFVQGVADGLGCDGLTACLEPDPGRCCVKARPTADQ
ncbi:helix-turn-helix domain-containing protein [Tessaracoccus rhinocerotis]|uniref:Helix-turn-helix domain-containing protein n=1 Tax=Tessaracoccus rhinocerotis TaxID=1689449 RepID=A0A553JX59_9ACTN|nr:helix-turn-helix domain-containing protein [Tessaracoccus rhinocerotis]TRY17010.1 helix-turn-helix domain-containing protein [Tessaracoccus rhinocerotis]